MPTNNPSLWTVPAFWSAVAAGGSLLTSLITLRINHRNMVESMRPELLPTEWTYTKGALYPGETVIGFGKIRNIGRGAAYNVTVSVDENLMQRHKEKVYLDRMIRSAAIAPNDSFDAKGSMSIYWEDEGEGGKKAYMTFSPGLIIEFYDARRVKYVTRYTLFARSTISSYDPGDLVPGVGWLGKTTTQRPFWRSSLIYRGEKLRKTVEQRSKKLRDRLRRKPPVESVEGAPIESSLEATVISPVSSPGDTPQSPP